MFDPLKTQPVAVPYFSGWRMGVKMVEAYRDYPKLCLQYARLLMRMRKDSDEARGFFDAVLAGMGA